MPGKQRAIGYVRVSTAEQVSKGQGLDVQEKSVRAWCKSKGIRLLRVARDEGLSGANGLDTRDGLAQALAELERGDAELLVVHRLDRLARDLLLQESIVQRLARRDVRVVSVSEPDVDGDEPTRDLVRQIFGVLAQYERAVIRGRLLAGKRAKKAKGGFVGGQVPFGWRVVNKELVPQPDEQKAIKRAHTLSGKGWSLREIAGELDAMGARPRNGGEWHATQVARVLERAERA